MKRPINFSSSFDSHKIDELRRSVNDIISYQTPENLKDGSIISWDISSDKNAKVTLGGNRTIELNVLNPGDNGKLVVVQDSVGGRTLDVPLNSKFGDTVISQLILSSNPNATDIYEYYYDGVFIYWERVIDENRIITLENNEYKITYFTEISSSTGTITIPAEATILLNQFQSGVDAYVSEIQNGQPSGEFPRTSGGVIVDVSSFDALGNFVITGVPSSYPVALIYVLRIKAKYYSNLGIDNIIDLEDNVFLEDRVDKLQSTRFISGAGVTLNANPTKFDIHVVGEIVDPITFAPTPISVNLTAQTATYIGTQVESYVWIDSIGTVVQSLTPPTPDLFDTIVGYWVLVHADLANITVINSFPYYADGMAVKFRQLLSFIGFKKFSGTNQVSIGTTGLRVSHSGGFAIKGGLGNTTKRPVANLSGATDATFQMRHRNGVYISSTQTLDVANYNPSGSTISALLPTTFSAFKVWKFASSLIRIQYGQYQYATINEALLKIDTDAYADEGNASRNGVHIGWIVVKSNLASWAAGVSGVDYKIVDVTDGRSSGSGFAPTMQSVYDISLPTAEFITNSTQGAMTGKGGTGVDTDNVWETKNNAGVITHRTTAEGFTYQGKKRNNMGNTNYSMVATDQIIYTGTAFTAARTVTLVSAASVPAGTEILVNDLLGTVTSTNTLTIAVQTGEKLNTTTNGTETISTASSFRRLFSNGVDAWSFDAGVARLNAVQTLTNKRITPRVTSTASSATPTPSADNDDEYILTALATNPTFAAPSGTPVQGQVIIIRIKDNGTARTLAFNAIYRFSSDNPAPTTTVLSKTMYIMAIYNAEDTKWDCMWRDNF